MAAKNLYIGWSGVTITPTDPSTTAITIDKITDIEVDGKSMQEVFYGDTKQFADLIVNTQKTRKVTIKGGNIGKFMTIPEDAECTIVAILNDAKNGIGTGAITFTAIRATCDGKPFKGSESKFATGDLTFSCAGGTDDADPITIAVAA